MIAQASNNNCVPRALSTMRLALGYSTGEPEVYDLGEKFPSSITSSLGDWFPYHRCFVSISKEEFAKSKLAENVEYLGDHFTWGEKKCDNEICCDDWLIAFAYNNDDKDEPKAHMVIGFPVIYSPGTSISIVIGVSLK